MLKAKKEQRWIPKKQLRLLAGEAIIGEKSSKKLNKITKGLLT